MEDERSSSSAGSIKIVLFSQSQFFCSGFPLSEDKKAGILAVILCPIFIHNLGTACTVHLYVCLYVSLIFSDRYRLRASNGIGLCSVIFHSTIRVYYLEKF